MNNANPLAAFGLEPDVDKVSERFIENIEYILEQNNMAVREVVSDCQVQYRIYKRSAHVDAVLECAPELSEVLLSYLDIRNSKDEQFKKYTLKALADYLEPNRRNYNGTAYKGLCDDVFTVFNKCNIRHNDKNQIKLPKKKRMELYDSTFKMCLHLLQMQEVNDYKLKVEEIKQLQ